MTVAPERRRDEPAETGGPSTAGAAAAGGDAETAPPKSKKKLVIVVAVLVVLLLVGFVAKGKLLKHHYGPADPAPAGQVFSLGSVTTSLSDGHLLQTSIDLQLTVVAASKQVSVEQPKLLNAAIQTLGEQTYGGLLGPTGRTALKHDLLVDFQKVLGTSLGGQEVRKVYLTSFVLQ